MALYNPRDANGRYMFSSRPRPAENLCRSQDTSERKPRKYGNIMYDRRVVRGNTYAQHIIPTTVLPDPAEAQRQQELRRRALARRREQSRLRTPEALLGRKHMDVQTERYLEELSSVIVTTNIECQTDAFLDRPASPLFIPRKSGKDAETQILEGELFDFDREVVPVVEVIVGKTIEQSVLEVMEEEELECLRAQQKAFEELRNAELAEVHRMQEQNRRRTEEKERRIAQVKMELQLQKETAAKIAARAFAQHYLADLLPSVFTSLRRDGFFYDPMERDVESNFLPRLMTDVSERLEKKNVARQLLDNLICEVVQSKLEFSSDQEPMKTEPGV